MKNHSFQAVAFILALHLVFASNSFSQISSLRTALAKVDIELKELIAEYDLAPSNHPQTDQLVPIIFKSSAKDVVEMMKRHKGQLHCTLGDIHTGLVPLSELSSFAFETSIQRVESAQRAHFTNDTAKRLVGADKVLAGALAGGIPFTGKGVIVGIIDTGIDFAHPDFRRINDRTATRIHAIWDQTRDVLKAPIGFDYGCEFLNDQIDSALSNPDAVPTFDFDGHGTHVAGTAAGLRGMAPDADIVAVKAKINWSSDSTIATDTKSLLDAVAYITQKAITAGKPCVINLSIAYYVGTAHDGSSLVEQGFDNAVNSRSGIMICLAGGNETGRRTHFGGFELSQDSVWTYANGFNESMLYAIFDSKHEDSTFISLSTDSAGLSGEFQDSISGQKTKFHSGWLSIKNILDSPTGLTFKTVFGIDDSIATTKVIAARTTGGKTAVRITMTKRGKTVFTPAKLTVFRLAFKGAGTFHSWWENYQIRTFGSPSYLPAIDTSGNYRTSDDMYNVNILANGRKTFAIGAYVNREKYVDTQGNLQDGMNWDQSPAGTIAFFSNLGPTTDGRIKPDFCAPGLNVASSKSRNSNPDNSEMTDSMTVVLSGTSMASPVAAGAIALYLEKYPSATYDQAFAALRSTVSADIRTLSDGPLPNKTWGHGRLNIFKAMGGVVGVDGTEREVSTCNETVYPNPASKTIFFDGTSGSEEVYISVFDAKGELVMTKTLHGSSNSIDVNGWSAGVYSFSISGSKSFCAGRFVVG